MFALVRRTVPARRSLTVACLMLLAAAAVAQANEPLPEPGELPVHKWVVPPPGWSPEAYFTNLRDGATLESPFVARFGLSMRGIVPAGQSAGHAGHHHLLINQPLPLDFRKPLPFTDQYIHFGKGQMEAVIDLPPGNYSLRLVLADQGHIPFFVYSKPLRLTVSRQRKGVASAALLGAPRIEILSPADRATVQVPLRIQLHASGYNVSHAAPKLPETGRFRLTLQRPGQRPEVIELDGGQTELWLSPPKGSYTVKAEFLNNADGRSMASARPVGFTVAP